MRQLYCPWLLFHVFMSQLSKGAAPGFYGNHKKKLQKMRGVPPKEGGGRLPPLTSPHGSFFTEVVSEKSRRSWER